MGRTANKVEPDRNGLSVRFVIALLDILTYFSTILQPLSNGAWVKEVVSVPQQHKAARGMEFSPFYVN